MAECPNCERYFEFGDENWESSFCPKCGQALKWEVLEEVDHIIKDKGGRDNLEKIKQETITIKQLEEMYDKFQKKLWHEHEDVRGDDMIEIGYAEQFLQDLLMEFGCWEEVASEG